jgi:hypothetical protein
LTTDFALLGANAEYAVFTVRVSREFVSENHYFLNVLSDLAGDIEVEQTPALEQEPGGGSELLKTPLSLIGTNDEFAVLSVRVPRKFIAENHAFLVTLASLAPPAPPASD